MDRQNRIALAVVAGLLLLIAGIIVIVATAEEQHAVVQSVQWEREIKIERYKWVNESDWYLPSDANLFHASREIHHYDTEYYTDGDGNRQSRSEPVYRTKYYYEIERWRYERSIVTSGDTQDASWGEVSLESKEREGSRREQYGIQVLTPDATTETFHIDYTDWQRVKTGRSVRVKRYIGGIYTYPGLLE